MANVSKLNQDFFYAMVIKKNGTLQVRKFSWDSKEGPFYSVPLEYFDLNKHPEIQNVTNLTNLKDNCLRNVSKYKIISTYFLILSSLLSNNVKF